MNKAVKIIGGIVIVLVLMIGGTVSYGYSEYKNVASCKQDTVTSWSKVENQMNRRGELIDQLVSVVKADSVHESKAIQAVADARAHYVAASDNNAKLASYQGTMLAIQSVAENYPNLKADARFADLFSTTENSQNRINIAIGNYIKSVDKYDRLFISPITGFIARLGGYDTIEPYKADDKYHSAPDMSKLSE